MQKLPVGNKRQSKKMPKVPIRTKELVFEAQDNFWDNSLYHFNDDDWR